MRIVSPLAIVGVLLLASGCDSLSDEPGPPRTAEIVRITVNDAPLTDVAGDGWDGGSGLSDGPEVYFRLFDNDIDYVTDPGLDRLNPRDDSEVVALGSSSSWFEGVEVADFPLIWDVEPGYVVRDLDDPLYLALFDYDPTNDDDPMAESEEFTLRDVAPATVTGQAQVITLGGFDRNGDSTDDFSVRVTVEFFD